MKLYLYPGLFGLKDYNPFGLKVATFLTLVNIDHKIEHLVDTSKAPRNQLPFMEVQGQKISDSNHMIETLIDKYQLTIDLSLTETEKAIAHAATRMLDENLYWVMSYSRWQDDHLGKIPFRIIVSFSMIYRCPNRPFSDNIFPL